MILQIQQKVKQVFSKFLLQEKQKIFDLKKFDFILVYHDENVNCPNNVSFKTIRQEEISKS